MSDPLANLPRLGDEALGPCAVCRKPILETGMPIFYRVQVHHCGIDANAVRERAGLAMMLGGGAGGLAIADAIGAHKQPVVVLSEGTTNVCHACASDQPDLMTTLFAAYGEPDHV